MVSAIPLRTRLSLCWATGLLTIAVYARENNVAESPARDGLGRLLGLVDIERWGRLRGLDGAEPTAARARVAHELKTQ